MNTAGFIGPNTLRWELTGDVTMSQAFTTDAARPAPVWPQPS
jgi:hypothetical protein